MRLLSCWAVVAQGDLEARLVPHLPSEQPSRTKEMDRSRRAADGAERGDEDAVADGKDAPGVGPVDARSLVVKGGGGRV